MARWTSFAVLVPVGGIIDGACELTRLNSQILLCLTYWEAGVWNAVVHSCGIWSLFVRFLSRV